MGKLSITKEPMAIDFIKNDLSLEFQLSGYDAEKGLSILNFSAATIPIPSLNGKIIFSFLGHTVTFRMVDVNSSEKNNSDTLIWYPEIEIQPFGNWDNFMAECERKIKNHPLFSRYYDIRIFKDPFDMAIMLESKTVGSGSLVWAKLTGTRWGHDSVSSRLFDGKDSDMPQNWKLWSKFTATRTISAYNHETIETPELLFDVDTNNKIKIPLTILKDYFFSADIPAVNEPIIAKGYPIFHNSIKAKFLYAESYGENFTVGLISQSKEYLLFNGELERNFHENKFFDWVTKDYPNFYWIPSTTSEIMVWGTHGGETVRIFKEQPQWLYISTLKQTGIQAKVLWLEVDYYVPPYSPVPIMPSFQLTLLPGSIYRIPISMAALGLSVQPFFSISIKENNATKPFFRREFEVVEKPYNARMFVLQNKYGLLESFFIDNLLEEKNVDGDNVVLGENHKLDISKIETIYTARTGSKRISEMQVLKYAIENPDNYIVQDNALIPITFLPTTLEVADEEQDLQRAEVQFILTKGAKALPGVYGGSGSLTKLVNQIPRANSFNNSLSVPIRLEFLGTLVASDVQAIAIVDKNNIPIPFTTKVEDNVLLILHEGLERGTEYTVTLPDTVFPNFEGLEFSFTTLDEIEVTEVLPQHNSIENVLTTQISVKFNQDIEAENLGLIGIIPNGIIETSVFGNILLISHNRLKNSEKYSVDIPIGTIKDYNKVIKWEFDTITEIAVTELYPAFFSTEVNVNEVIKVVFNQDVTISDKAKIEITAANGKKIAVTNLETQDNTLFVQHADFEYNTEYRIVVSHESIIGYNKTISWQFTTLKTAFIPLEVIDISAKGDSVPVNEAIVITFSKNITPADLSKITIRNVVGDELENVTATILDNKLTILHPIFEYLTEYFVLIPDSSINDFNEDISFNFRTITFVEILSITPADGDADVPPDAEIKVVFNQKITAKNLNLITIKTEDGKKIDISPAVNDAVIILKHNELKSKKIHIVEIPAGSVLGYNKNVSWKFTSAETENSGSGGEAEPPVVIDFKPTGTGIPVSTKQITVFFDKPIEIEQAEKINLFCEDKHIDFEVNTLENVLQITLKEALEQNKIYTINIPAGCIKNYNRDIFWEFVTEKKEEPPTK